MSRVDIITGAIERYQAGEAIPSILTDAKSLARFIDSHLKPEPDGRIADALERIARCAENIDARQANRDFKGSTG